MEGPDVSMDELVLFVHLMRYMKSYLILIYLNTSDGRRKDNKKFLLKTELQLAWGQQVPSRSISTSRYLDSVPFNEG